MCIRPIVFISVTQDTELSSVISTKPIQENVMKNNQILNITHLNIQLERLPCRQGSRMVFLEPVQHQCTNTLWWFRIMLLMQHYITNLLCLSQGFTAVNRHYDQGNSYKDNISLRLAYRFRVQSIIIKAGTWQHPGRHGAGGAESSTSEGCQWKTDFQPGRVRVLSPCPQ